MCFQRVGRDAFRREPQNVIRAVEKCDLDEEDEDRVELVGFGAEFFGCAFRLSQRQDL